MPNNVFSDGASDRSGDRTIAVRLREAVRRLLRSATGSPRPVRAAPRRRVRTWRDPRDAGRLASSARGARRS